MTPRLSAAPALGGPGVDHGQAGFYAPALGPFAIQRVSALVANRAYTARVVCPKSQTISKIAFVIATAAGADDACDLGIYSGMTLLGSSGSTLGRLNSTGVKVVNLTAPVALVAGQVYYAAFASGAQGGSAASPVHADLAGIGVGYLLAGMFGTTPPQVEQNSYANGFPLQTGFPGSTPQGPANLCPIMALQQ